jgi:D-alanyl-lipoteichoic acid acyltransferase DltB (MBOAT superfamily)
MITMTVGGLWHGASWNFVIWGAYFGVLLCAERFWRKWRKRQTASVDPPELHASKVVLTFALFVLGSPFFRAASFPDALQVIRQMFAGTPGPMLLNTWHLELLAVSLGLAVAEEKLGWFEKAATGSTWAYTAALTAMLLCLELFAVTEVSVPFVYFQF